MSKLHLLTQYLTPHHLVSRLMAIFVTRRWPKALKNWQINKFIRTYDVDMSLAVKPRAEDYDTFNAFFTRHLKPGARPIDPDPNALVSPADGVISQLGPINKCQLVQAKGMHYSVDSLLGKQVSDPAPFDGGQFVTIYLSPKDYHRVHMPITGRLLETTYVPGRLFSVNPRTTAKIPTLFSRNERLICHFETEIGQIAVILVGAMLVSGIQTTWAGRITPSAAKTIIHTDYRDQSITLQKGDELGYFEFGSTVIILLPNQAHGWQKSLSENAKIHMGEAIYQN